MVIGYARVSTDDQDTAAQVAALPAAGSEYLSLLLVVVCNTLAAMHQSVARRMMRVYHLLSAKWALDDLTEITKLPFRIGELRHWQNLVFACGGGESDSPTALISLPMRLARERRLCRSRAGK